MKLPAYLRSIAARFLRSSQTEADLEQELLSHIQHRSDDLERSGLRRDEAERLASVEFGGRQRFKEEAREQLGGNFLDTVAKDVRYSLRVLRKSPGFTFTAVFTLTLAIGANAVVFGVLNAVMLRPLNVPQPESLFMIERGTARGSTSYPDYADLRDRNRSFDGLAAFNIGLVGLDAGGNPTRAWVNEVTGNYFDALRVQPYLGRFIHASDERGPNSAPYIVLSHDYWQSHFQGDRGVVGRTVQLNRHPFVIIGVAPPEFRGTLLFAVPDFFVPIVNQEQLDGESTLNARGNRSAVFCVFGHLKRGVTQADAVADLDSIGADLERTYPKDDAHVNFVLARPGLYGNFLGPPVRAFAAGLMMVAGLILLAACANLGSLFAARATDRSREIALRLALGASRTRILRALFAEAALISAAGGALGLWGSVALLRAVAAWQPIPRFPAKLPVSPDANVYAAALFLGLLSAILFGLAPVRHVMRVGSYQIIKSGTAGAIGRRIRVRDLLLAAQIAICAVLVTSSMVAARGLVRSIHSEYGFEPQDRMLVNIDPAMAGYRGSRARDLKKRVIEAFESIPGVDSVGLVDQPPLYGGSRGALVFRDDMADLRPANAAALAYWYRVSPQYLQAAGTALLAGRGFTWHDDENAPRVALVNRELARKVFGSVDNATGKYIKLRDGARVEVAGIVEDGKYFNLTEDPQPAIFTPFLQGSATDAWLILHSKRDQAQLAPAIKDVLRNVDRSMPSYISTWTKEMEFPLFPSRIATVSLGVLGAMGAMLSITGIFGTAAYSVSRRRKELAIRIAVGAKAGEVLRAALGRAFQLLAFGSAAGLALGILATKVLASIVYQATPRDPLVLTGVVLAMLLVGLVATWIPAQRALSIDPLKLLREE